MRQSARGTLYTALLFVFLSTLSLYSQFEKVIDLHFSIDQFGTGMQTTPDNGSIVVGNNITNAGNDEAFAAKFDEDGNVQWMREYPSMSGTYDFVRFTDVDLLYDASGTLHEGYVITGSVEKPNVDDRDILVARIDLQGQVVWSTTYQSPKFNDGNIYQDEGLAVIQDGNGNIAVTGYTNGDEVTCGQGNVIGSRADMFLLRLDPNGAWLSWAVVGEEIFGTQPHFRYMTGYGLTEYNTGGLPSYIVVGTRKQAFAFDPAVPETCTQQVSYMTHLAKFSSAGQHLWSRNIPDPPAQMGLWWSGDIGYDVIQTQDGGIALVGALNGSIGSLLDGVYVVKTNANGMVGPGFPNTWSREIATVSGGGLCFSQASTWEEIGKSIVETDIGDFIITGTKNNCTSSGGFQKDMTIIRISSDGDVMHAIQHGGTGNEQGEKVTLSNDHSYYTATGTSSSYNSNIDLYLVKGSITECARCGNSVPLISNDPEAEAITFIPTIDHLANSTPQIRDLGQSYNEENVCDPEFSCGVASQNYFHNRYQAAGYEYGMDGEETDDGGFIVAGFDKDKTGTLPLYGALLAKTDNQGLGSTTSEWIKRYETGNGDIEGRSVAEKPTGNAGYAVAGYAFLDGDNYGEIPLFFHTNLSGTLSNAWTYFPSDAVSIPRSASVYNAHNSGFILSYELMTDSVSDSKSITYVLRTDANGSVTPMTGNQKWAYMYEMDESAEPASAIPTSDGNYAVAGNHRLNGNVKPFLMKLDDYGNVDWAYEYGGSNFYCTDFAETSDEGFIMTGVRLSFSAGIDAGFVMKLSSTGSVEWTQVYIVNSNSSPVSSQLNSIISESNGEGYAASGQVGRTASFPHNGWILRMDNCGVPEWTTSAIAITPADFDTYASISETSNGEFFTTGTISSGDPLKADMWGTLTTCDGTVCLPEQISLDLYEVNMSRQSITVNRYDAAYEEELELDEREFPLELMIRICPDPPGNIQEEINISHLLSPLR